MSKILSRYAETGSYKPGVNTRRQTKAETRQYQEEDGVTTEESDESKSNIFKTVLS